MEKVYRDSMIRILLFFFLEKKKSQRLLQHWAFLSQEKASRYSPILAEMPCVLMF